MMSGNGGRCTKDSAIDGGKIQHLPFQADPLADNFLTCRAGCHDTFRFNAGTAKFLRSALDADDHHAGIFGSVDIKTQTDDGKGNSIKHTSTGSSQSGNVSGKMRWTVPSHGGLTRISHRRDRNPLLFMV